ncbi:BTB/POZ and MATH domain-containing protein 1-like, partial [Triticum aestivum]
QLAEPESSTTIVGSSVFHFKLDYEQVRQLPTGKSVFSDAVSAGGHLWRIECLPRGVNEADREYVSIFLEHMSKSKSVGAFFEVLLMGRDGKPCLSHIRRAFETFEITEDGDTFGWHQFRKGTVVEKDYLTGRHVTFVCAIMVVDDSPILVPSSDIGTHLGRLLDRAHGTDVSFVVDDVTFRAHPAVLAARSPVFRAELFGSMSEATMPSITLHDIKPATFKVMLRFIYTDELPEEDELEDSSAQMFQDLLAAADRYALDRLKIICAQKLWQKVSVDTVATILAWAENYNCQELKNKCIDFFVVEENFRKAMFTDGYGLLLLKFPAIIDELRKRV